MVENQRLVVEVAAHRVDLGRVLVEDLEVELVGPPLLIRGAARDRGAVLAVHERAFAGVGWVGGLGFGHGSILWRASGRRGRPGVIGWGAQRVSRRDRYRSTR